MTGLHRSRRRLTFGSMAEAYERWRPTYPRALIDDLVALGPRDVLDVGAGTGKAGGLLAARGCSVVGVEPDPRMAAIARTHGYVAVEEAPFETWDAGGRSFDLLISGQAWHWVDPQVGPGKAWDLLRPGGHMAAFWNFGTHDPELLARLEPVYRRIVPEIAGTTMALGQRGDHNEEDGWMLSGAGFELEGRTYTRVVRLSREQWIGYLTTCSDHILLPEAVRSRLLDEVGRQIDAAGGTVTWHMGTWLALGRRGTG